LGVRAVSKVLRPSNLRKRGYRILKLSYSSYTDKKRDELYRDIMLGLGK
jgi:hypothetical protein